MAYIPVYDTQDFKDELASVLPNNWRSELDMLKVMRVAEKAIPDLLVRPWTQWQTLSIGYAPPYLLRIHETLAASNGKRIRLNGHYFFSPSDSDSAVAEAGIENPYTLPGATKAENDPNDLNLNHPHAWAAAFRIWKGFYNQRVGRADRTGLNARPLRQEFRLQAEGSVYAFNDPLVWHMVEPDPDVSVTTLMVTHIPDGWGQVSTQPKRTIPYSKRNIKFPSDKRPLTNRELQFMVERFRQFYPGGQHEKPRLAAA